MGVSKLRVEKLRVAAGLSKAELARRAGINERTVRKIEGGEHSPSITTAVKLADALGVPFLELFEDATSK